MIAVDTNLLIYAHREDADFHHRALSALLDLAESGNRWSIPWPCLHEFLAITTHPRIFTPPSPMATALEAIDVWISSPGCEMIGEEPGYFEVLRKLTTEGKIAGPAIHDTRIAAICIHHGVQTLWTADRDFSRFGALRTHNPIAVN
jgi:toxin-antitoxin system PIN domain toxin